MRAAVITGAGQGIGAAVAEGLSEAGHAIAVCDLNAETAKATAQAIGEKGGKAEAFIGDATDAAWVDALLADVRTRLGPIALIHANAGMGGFGPVERSKPDRWWKTVEINLKHPYLFARYGLHYLRETKGRFIITASEAGTRGEPNAAAYAASKGAAILLAESLGAELGADGPYVFAIHPGGVLTPGAGAGLRPESPLPEEMKAQMRSVLCDPVELVVTLVQRLASGEADVLSGSYISAHDNLDALIASAERQTLRLQKIP